MTSRPPISPFNSSIETGIRSLTILVAGYPNSFDLERLIEMDYLVVHSGDADGPSSLHVSLPMREGQLLVRRELIEKGLLLMMSRNLVQRTPDKKGFNYLAGETASPFLKSLASPYSQKLKERASWVIDNFADVPTVSIRKTTRKLFKNWSEQFQVTDKLGDIR